MEAVCSILSNPSNSLNNGEHHGKLFSMGSAGSASSLCVARLPSSCPPSYHNNSVLKSTLLYLHRRYIEGTKEK